MLNLKKNKQMAKELPYFKFEPNAWENGNIQMLSREDKGLFIDICSILAAGKVKNLGVVTSRTLSGYLVRKS